MTKQEYKKIRSEYRFLVKSAWEEYAYYNGDGFNPNNPKANAAFERCARLIDQFISLTHCPRRQVADVLNIQP